jgi:aryl-alcohol dehydrogenase-like predicted oxidoreductase
MIQSDPQVIPLVAVSRMEHLKEDLAAAELELCRQSMDLLNWPIDPIE